MHFERFQVANFDRTKTKKNGPSRVASGVRRLLCQYVYMVRRFPKKQTGTRFFLCALSFSAAAVATTAIAATVVAAAAVLLLLRADACF